MEKNEFIEVPRREDINAEEALGAKKPATEETLQSIDATLKRIEIILGRMVDGKEKNGKSEMA